MANNQIIRKKGITIIQLGQLEVRTNMIRRSIEKSLQEQKVITPSNVVWALKRKINK